MVGFPGFAMIGLALAIYGRNASILFVVIGAQRPSYLRYLCKLTLVHWADIRVLSMSLLWRIWTFASSSQQQDGCMAPRRDFPQSLRLRARLV